MALITHLAQQTKGRKFGQLATSREVDFLTVSCTKKNLRFYLWIQPSCDNIYKQDVKRHWFNTNQRKLESLYLVRSQVR